MSAAHTGLLRAFLTLDQAAETIGCTRRFIEERVKDGEIQAFRPSARMVRIHRKEFDRWVEEFSTGTKSATAN